MIYRDKFTTLVLISFVFMLARRGVHKRKIRKKTHANPGKDENSIKKATPEKQRTPAGTSDSPAASNSFPEEKPISVPDPSPPGVSSMTDKTSNNCETGSKETENYSPPWENPLSPLESAMGSITCGICGTDNNDIARFCKDCGIVITAPHFPAEVNICTICGTENDDKARFCKDCGNPLLTTHSQGQVTTSEPVREFNSSDPISANSNDIPYFSLVHDEVEPPYPISKTGSCDIHNGLTGPFSLIPDPGFPMSDSGSPILSGLQQPFHTTYIPSQPSFHGLYISRQVDIYHPSMKRRMNL